MSKALSKFSQELVTIKDMDKAADKLLLQMVYNPSLGLLTELESLRNSKAFYSVEVLKFLSEAPKIQINNTNDRLNPRRKRTIGDFVFAKTDRNGEVYCTRAS